MREWTELRLYFGRRIDSVIEQKLMQRTVLRTTEQLLGSEELFFFSFGQALSTLIFLAVPS